MRKIIDLSINFDNDGVSDPPGYGPKIKYRAHKETVDELLPFFPGLTKEELPDGEAWANEWVQMTTHCGTHLDAPYHFHSTMNKGERSWTIDEVPLEWCFQPGVKLDFRRFADGYVATARDVEAELQRIGHTLNRWRSSSSIRAPASFTVNRAMSQPAAAWATRRPMFCPSAAFASPEPTPGAGTRRCSYRQEVRAKPGAELIWEGHKAGRDIGYRHLEKLHNLELLPADGFQIVCLPCKVKGASAGWTRAAAIFS